VEQDAFYQAVGGHPTFVTLVERFYAGVEDDDLLRPMYPDDLAGARERMTWFLEQYWGGPTTYSEQRGHPALRMRHAQFRLDGPARDHWLAHMRSALDSLDLPAEHTAPIWHHLERTADFLRNVPDPPTDERTGSTT
jgi:hemoglobin